MTEHTARDSRWTCRRSIRQTVRGGMVAAMVISAGLSAAVVLRAAGGQGGTAGAGVYTDAQSQRGEAVAEKSCVSCHGPKLSGSDIGPTLQGDYFMGNWKDMTAAALFDKIQQTMPADAPGSLSPQQTSDLIAYIFKLNGFPPGATDLPGTSAALANIKISK